MTKSQITAKFKRAAERLEEVQEDLDELYYEIQDLRDAAESDAEREDYAETLDTLEEVADSLTDLIYKLED